MKQDAPKKNLIWLKIAPKWSQDGQVGAKMAKLEPRWSQDSQRCANIERKDTKRNPKREGAFFKLIVQLPLPGPVEAEPTGKRQREQGELEGSLWAITMRVSTSQGRTHSLY